MIKNFVIIAAMIFAAAVSTTFAQKVYTPAKGSTERATILNALRVPVGKDLKQSVTFIADNFKVSGDWAFISGRARGGDGGDVNWKITEYQTQIDADAFEDNFFGLLRKTNGKWRVITYMIGCTDVCYIEWSKDYKAPKILFD